MDFLGLCDISNDENLRDYQQENKNKIYDMWQTSNSVMLQMPTGTGKTRLFSSIIRDVQKLSTQRNAQYKVLVLVHRIELIQQICDNLGNHYNIDYGVIQACYDEKISKCMQVASVQTLIRRLDRWSDVDFDVIIIDEAHHALAESYKKICTKFSSAKILGVTATPCRLNGVGFNSLFEKLIVSPSVSNFISNKWLCDYEYYSIRTNSPIMKAIGEIKEINASGDYAESALMEVCNTDKIRAKIIETYRRNAEGKKGIVYTINIEHNELICNEFINAGYKAVSVDSKTDEYSRKKIIADFVCGKVDILCNVNIFSEGFDCPDVEFIQLARPTKSLSLYLQQIGRGFRISDAKEKVILLDNVGLYSRFGLPSADRMWLKHFNGDKISEHNLKGKLDGETRSVYVIKDYEEGDETIELIHSSEIYEPPTLMPKNECFFSCFLLWQGKSKGQVSKLIDNIHCDIDFEIREQINGNHTTIFDTLDSEYINSLITKLKPLIKHRVSTIKSKHSGNYSFLYPLNLYYDFSLVANSVIEPTTLEQINDLIYILEENDIDVSESLYRRRESLKKEKSLIKYTSPILMSKNECYFSCFLLWQGKSEGDINKLIYNIHCDIDFEIREQIDENHTTVFDTIDSEHINWLISKLKPLTKLRVSAIKKQKGGSYSFTYPLNLYYDFSLVAKSIIQSRTLEQINELIYTLEENSIEISEDIYRRKAFLEKERCLSKENELEEQSKLAILAKVNELISPIFQGCKHRVYFNVSYSPLNGLSIRPDKEANTFFDRMIERTKKGQRKAIEKGTKMGGAHPKYGTGKDFEANRKRGNAKSSETRVTDRLKRTQTKCIITAIETVIEGIKDYAIEGEYPFLGYGRYKIPKEQWDAIHRTFAAIAAPIPPHKHFDKNASLESIKSDYSYLFQSRFKDAARMFFDY